jgi:uncharacterized membrane protein
MVIKVQLPKIRIIKNLEKGNILEEMKRGM